MAYSDFTLKSVKQTFSLKTDEQQELFAKIVDVKTSEHLTAWLQEQVPLGLAIGTQKARSEMIIAPILVEARKLMQRRVSLFSGVGFDVAPDQGLSGMCDFIFCRSAEQLMLTSPFLVVVGAEKEDINQGIARCIAEMVAARMFNEREETGVKTIYGVVTVGSIWKFLKLEGQTVFVDRGEYYLPQTGKILAILLHIFHEGGTVQRAAA
ncbi:MAG TPA: hypothetical protein PLD20_16110 [Blastocatellia bacterium]|nr:hypothetical protein [Blastocatellia bacterium]HMV83998.1 hypothetical protein [Blastocatellia bacterium]HMX24870.1 hypothetical protein [Blastocatellia bacterium]HMZ19463.1 hypothetical protein [Blastocatellia bacterium]HNG33908.1 hypothetical protein [Blastocatellia bacterium]